MLILLIDHLIGVADKVLEEILSALLDMQRLELGIGGIPLILIGPGIDIINAGILNEQSFCYFLEDRIIVYHQNTSCKGRVWL